MDARLIYEAAKAFQYKIEWIKVALQSEWIFIGEEDDVNKVTIIENIRQHFDDEILHVILHRVDSYQTTKQNVIDTINDLPGIPRFLIWDRNFNKVIEFNRIGIMRCGSRRKS